MTRTSPAVHSTVQLCCASTRVYQNACARVHRARTRPMRHATGANAGPRPRILAGSPESHASRRVSRGVRERRAWAARGSCCGEAAGRGRVRRATLRGSSYSSSGRRRRAHIGDATPAAQGRARRPRVPLAAAWPRREPHVASNSTSRASASSSSGILP